MNVLPVGGKSGSDTLVGLAVSNAGDIYTQKNWSNSVATVYDSDETPAPASTSYAIRCTSIDITNAAAVSLRVDNSTDVDIKLGLYRDDLADNIHQQMRDGNGDLIRYLVKAGKTNVIITPEDWSVLQWLRKLRLIFYVVELPTTGTVKINAIVKK